MRISLFIIGVILFVGSVFSWPFYNDQSTKPLQANRELANFESVDVSGNIQLEINYSNREPNVHVKGPNQANIETIVKDGTLKIRPKRIGAKVEETIVIIHVPFLNKLAVSGSCVVDIFGNVVETDLKIAISGASTIRCSADFNHFKLACSGASMVKLDGSAMISKMQISGASHVEANTFEIKRLKIQGSGSSQSSVRVTESLSAAVSGSSIIEYDGNPQVEKRTVTGASRLTKR